MTLYKRQGLSRRVKNARWRAVHVTQFINPTPASSQCANFLFPSAPQHHLHFSSTASATSSVMMGGKIEEARKILCASSGSGTLRWTENELLSEEARKGFQHCIINLWRAMEWEMSDSRKASGRERRARCGKQFSLPANTPDEATRENGVKYRNYFCVASRLPKNQAWRQGWVDAGVGLIVKLCRDRKNFFALPPSSIASCMMADSTLSPRYNLNNSSLAPPAFLVSYLHTLEREMCCRRKCIST